MFQPDELVDEMRDALRHADSFGDICGIITAQCAYGTALLRAKNASHDEAIDVLDRAQANIQKHEVLIHGAGDHWCRSGGRCRTQMANGTRQLMTFVPPVLLHRSSGFRVFAGCTGEALIELLIDRGSTRRPQRGAPNRRPVADSSTRHPRAGPVVAEIARTIGQGGRRLGRLRRAGKAVPRALRERSTPVGDSMRRAGWSTKSVERVKRWRRYWPILHPHSVICCRSARC